MRIILSCILFITLLSACTPSVKVETPDEPITINLNIDINHKVKVQIDKQLENLIDSEEELF